PPIRDKLRNTQHTEERKADPELDTAATELSNAVQRVLDGLGALQPQPIGVLPFAALVVSIEEIRPAADSLVALLEKREREHEAKGLEGDTTRRAVARYRSNPFRDRRFRVGSLVAELRQAEEQLQRANELSEGKLLLLRGSAGTGKTHLLCDVARRRLAEGRPTVLLMGQRFVSHEEPWRQALQQVDLPGMSAEEFVGALEAAAQASGTRALIVLDAVNEGTGRTIWPSHMAAFLAQIERSPWIGAVMAVRTSYEAIVVPEDVRNDAVQVEHYGFREHEYDATRTFFLHYGLELPSTPLLDPEFRTPLFLKTLCRGLHVKGERRLPRGLHGITAVFDLYLGAVNERLATQLGFDPRSPLVRQALEAVASALIDAGKRWLDLQSAKTVVDALLPGRDFERSLYRGLVDEGILVEEAPLLANDSRGDVVFVAYERFSDHLVAKELLDRHLDLSSPASAFGAGGGLAFISNTDEYIPPGLLEALWVQVAERCGKELVALVPAAADHWNAAEAFRQSLVWRAVTAFSGETLDALDSLHRSEGDLHEALEALITVAVLPQHPLNARFLDPRLRKDAMADRDAWWSIYLHRAWGNHSAVDRLVDWASSLGPETPLEEDVVELAGTTLAWLFTSSNRYLRDRAFSGRTR
ncbi:MAG: ATP-binding protein, partial [Myxococcales bacterium]|nr:ATP-binding protein [Myxococcales bacterium]